MSSTSPAHITSRRASGTPEIPSHKISAYYSLVFPNITYYLQTLSVTIGRRCLPGTTNAPATSSDSQPQVDVDLGSLKSVSRLHAKIEWSEEIEKFVLVVIGRNGAWVDGVWSPSGSRVALGERSQIQIASRTFDFVLPPPSQPPNDPPSPGSSSSGLTDSMSRPCSPSVDVTSLSPPTSEHTSTPPSIPKHERIGRSSAKQKRKQSSPISKKRKKSERRPTPPAVLPPKPNFTYAQLCYRAIKAFDGKATLQDICGWMTENYDWYRYTEGSGWENSVRHNLSSNRAFKKMERCAGERGKGFFWSVDPNFEPMFEEQFATKKREKSGSSLLDPPLKRSIKGSVNGGVLPPPLTSMPRNANGLFPGPTSSPSATLSHPQSGTDSSFQPDSSPNSIPIATSAINSRQTATTAVINTPANALLSQQPATSTPSAPSTPFLTLPRIPFVIAPLPPSYKSTSTPPTTSASCGDQPNPQESLVLHEGKLYLHPTIFSDVTLEQLRELEDLGVQKAIEVLKGHIVNYLREIGRREGRARGKGRRKGAGKGAGKGGGKVGDQKGKETVKDGDEAQSMQAMAMAVDEKRVPDSSIAGDEIGREDSPIDIVADDDKCRASKRRKVDDPCETTDASAGMKTG